MPDEKMITSQKIRMTFSCDQDWNEMKVSGDGRHCEICSKTVFDFSDKAVPSTAARQGELCGMFRVEQIERDLSPIEVPLSLRTTLVTFAAVLGLELSQANAQELNQKQRIETVIGDSTTTNDATDFEGKSPSLNKAVECGNIKPRIKRKYYFSKRFPFIVKRKTRIVGRFRL